MKKTVLLLFLFILIIKCNAQTIRGTILDKSNGSKIDNATVYINGTSAGTYTNKEGNFELDISRYASMPLTISALGYYSITNNDFSWDKPLIVYLTPKVFEMEQVVIEAESLEKERKENLKIFIKEFLGTTGNALRCVIVNESDIRFNYGSSDDTLKAYASKPLIIYNNGLGYKITYYLDRFEYYKKSKSFLFNGSALFNEDLASDLNQIKSFDRRRKYAYLGSRSHLFSSLWTNSLKSNGFIVENSKFEKLEYEDIVTRRDSSEKYLEYNGKLKILSQIPGRPITNVKTNNILRIYYLSKTPIGFIEFIKDSVFIDGSGYFDGSGVRILGQMAKLRVGDLLPLDYKPELPQKGPSKLIQPTKDNSIEPQLSTLPPSRYPTNGVDSLVKLMNNNIIAVEKVYIETDRTNYLSGDTIWFSAFILESLNMDSTSLSRILHVDLINADNKLEKHLKLIIRNGHSSGNFALQKDLKNGIYRLRAYTQYMRNFQSEYIFEKDIPVRQSNFNKFIIVNPVINGDVKGDSVGLYLKTALPDEYINENKQLEVFVKLNDTLSVKKLFKFQNDLNRSLVFFVPASLSCSILNIRLTLSVKEVISEQRISLKLKSGISLQFFPESGKMIAGVQTVIAFKATDNESNPTGFDADIVDENQNEVLHLKGNKSGVGKFTFAPQANHTYKACLTLHGNKYFFNLPVTEPKGYILNFNSDSNIICIKNNQNINKSKHYLLVSVRGAVYTSIEIKLDTTTYRKLLSFESYPKGIVQITLFDSLYHPLAERLAFNNRPDQKMLIQVETDKEDYRQREKVNLTISVTDTDGNPIESSLTMAVVDASKTDSLSNSASIETSIYLASELKGEINYKSFNLSDTTSLGNQKIDLVMMTQGWRNFLWNSIRYTNKMTELYPIEKAFSVNGTVLNFKKGRSGSDYKLNFIDLKTSYNTIVNIDESNKFKIDIPFFYNDHFLFIQNRNKKDKVDNLDLTLDTVPVPVISYRYNELPYISYKSGYIKTINEKFTKIESINESFDNTINIPEVTIRGKYHPWDSEADITVNLDKKDPTGEKYTSLFQMIYEEFGEKAFTAVGYGTYKRSFPPILIVNGAHLTEESCPPCYDFEAYKWATIIPVNEISNVKFFEAGGEYSRFVTPPPPSVMDAIMPDIDLNFPGHNRLLTESLISNRIFPSVVSFTTYSNSYRGNPNGTIVFPFQGIYQEREFYKPDYENNLSLIPDNRTTIYWNPEIKTDSSGKTNISFYNSDLKGKAYIRISGVSYFLNDVASAASDYLSH